MLSLNAKNFYCFQVLFQVFGMACGVSDIFMGTNFMQCGQGPSGIIGITLKPETLKTCALGLHVRSRLEQDIAELT